MSANTTLESFVGQLGLSMWITAESALLYFVPSILGMLSQFACFLVFNQIKVASTLYIYLKAYTVNSFLVCCFLFTQYLTNIYSIGNSQASTELSCFFISTLLRSCYVNSTLLDILILLDRISVFNKRVKDLLKITRPYIQIFLLAVISILLNIPYYFLIIPQGLNYNQTNGSETTVWFSGSSPFSRTQGGYALIVSFIFVNYASVTVVQITLNIISAVYIRRHIKKKATRVGMTQIQGSNLQNVDVKTGLMVTLLCSISFIEHILIIVLTFNLFFPWPINVALFQWLVVFIITTRRFGDFFFYFIFNKVFKKQFLVSVRLVEETYSSTGVFSTNNRSIHR